MSHSNFPPFCFCYCLCAGGVRRLPARVGFSFGGKQQKKRALLAPTPSKVLWRHRKPPPQLAQKNAHSCLTQNCSGCCLVRHHWQKRSHLPSSTVQPQTRPLSPQFPPEQPLSLRLRRTADAQNLLIKILHWKQFILSQESDDAITTIYTKIGGVGHTKLKINWRFLNPPYSSTNCPGLIPKK